MYYNYAKNAVGFIIVSLIFLTMSCTTTLRNKQLERVAKDWALVIRASQVIPVYPLSEDLQPGDVFLVTTPVEDQVKIYKEKGFLSLDQHLVRINISPIYFKKFYSSRYGIDDEKAPPTNWQEINKDGKHNWEIAPHAAFPTYNFSVDTGLGLNVAIPIQGVPVALGLMNSGKASGSVTIADAYTYGLDTYILAKKISEWANQNRRFLSAYEPRGKEFHFLRVVNRIYITGRVNVTVKNDEATGAEAGAGADRPVNIMGIKEGASSENYLETINKLNSHLSEQLPGAKVKISVASSRSITLNETFTKPLVIGYIGFDMPIMKGGRLGAPISTLSQLTGIPAIEVSSSDIATAYRLAALSHMFEALKLIQGDEAKKIRAELDTLQQLLPGTYPFSLYTLESPTQIEKSSLITVGVQIKRDGFQAVLDYLNHAKTTIETLEGSPQSTSDPELSENLLSARTALKEIGEKLSDEPVLLEAIDYAFFGR